jgi:hypothetical protein
MSSRKSTARARPKPSKIKATKAKRRAARFPIVAECLYTFEECGHALDLSRSRVFNLVSINVIKTVKLPGCDRKIPGHEIIRISQQTDTPAGEL